MNWYQLFYNPNNWVGQGLLWMRALLQLPFALLKSSTPHAGYKAKLCLQLIPQYTMVKVSLLFAYYDLVKQIATNKVNGAVVECGVWNGGAAAIMAMSMLDAGENRPIWLFDSFEGVPEPTEKDEQNEKTHYFKGWLTGSERKVNKVLQKMGVSEEDIHIRRGWFKDTFPQNQIDQIAVLHIDADWYEPVKLCLEKFYPYMSPGGIVILNDYNHWLGCNKAVKEFLEANNLDVQVHPIASVGAYFRKPIE